MSQQQSNQKDALNKAPVSAEISFIILYFANLVTTIIGIVRDADGFWFTLLHTIICFTSI